jgi:ABC-type dipeptide/oligopeptide/nickel transport system permease subunit
MYEILTALFGIILIMSIIGIFKFGFNVVFFYIVLFSIVVVVWSVIAIIEEKKNN